MTSKTSSTQLPSLIMHLAMNLPSNPQGGLKPGLKMMHEVIVRPVHLWRNKQAIIYQVPEEISNVCYNASA